MGIARALVIVGASTFAVLPSPPVATQAASFEVSSVKRSNPAVGGPTMVRPGVLRPGGRWIAQNATLRLILQTIYPQYAQRARIVGGPSWIDSERFDIEARAAGEPSPEQLIVMVRNLLADRFALQTHTEARRLDVYVLVRVRADGRLGPGLAEPVPCRKADVELGVFADRIPKPGDLPPCGIWTVTEKGIRRYAAGDAPLSNLLRILQVGLDRPLIDRTQLTTTFAITLEVDQSSNLQGAGQAFVSPAASLYTAVREQFWLEFQPRQEPMDVLVIDNVDRPSPN